MDAPTAEVSAWASRRLRRRRWLIVSLVFLGLATLAITWYRQTRPAYLYAQAQDALRQGLWEKVDDLASRLHQTGQADYANLLHGEMLLAQGKPDQALATLNRVADQGALRLEAALLSGRCLLELGDLKEAHRVFSYVVEEAPDRVAGRRGLAAVAYDLGQLAEALEQLEVITKLDLADGRADRLAGLILKDLGQLDRAVDHYRQALDRELPVSQAREARQELSETLVQLRQYGPALDLLDTWKKDGQRDDAALVAVRAECLHRLNRPAEATEVLAQGLKLSPRSAALHRLRGQLHLDAREWQAAATRLEQAAQLEPYGYQEHFLLAQAYRGLNRMADAEREQHRAESLRRDLELATNLTREAMQRPWDADLRRRLAEVADRMHRPKLAALWRKAAEACVTPSSPNPVPQPSSSP
ncbi:MAG: tetratricopeptide repeat protein [Gemmataceae bacterium]